MSLYGLDVTIFGINVIIIAVLSGIFVYYFPVNILIAVLLFLIVFSELFIFIVLALKKPKKQLVIEIQKKDMDSVGKEIPIIMQPSKIEVKEPVYFASTKTMKYHIKDCRLIKNIDNKHKLSNSDLEFFLRREFKPCKICMK